MHLHAIPPHKVQKSPPLNVQSYKNEAVESPFGILQPIVYWSIIS
jgi:hypothetical protein